MIGKPNDKRRNAPPQPRERSALSLENSFKRISEKSVLAASKMRVADVAEVTNALQEAAEGALEAFRLATEALAESITESGVLDTASKSPDSWVIYDDCTPKQIEAVIMSIGETLACGVGNISIMPQSMKKEIGDDMLKRLKAIVRQLTVFNERRADVRTDRLITPLSLLERVNGFVEIFRPMPADAIEVLNFKHRGIVLIESMMSQLNTLIKPPANVTNNKKWSRKQRNQIIQIEESIKGVISDMRDYDDLMTIAQYESSDWGDF